MKTVFFISLAFLALLFCAYLQDVQGMDLYMGEVVATLCAAMVFGTFSFAASVAGPVVIDTNESPEEMPAAFEGYFMAHCAYSAQDIIRRGMQAGFAGFTHYADIRRVYETYTDEIFLALHEDAQERDQTLAEYMFSYWMDFDDEPSFQTVMVYMMAERTAARIAEEVEEFQAQWELAYGTVPELENPEYLAAFNTWREDPNSVQEFLGVEYTVLGHFLPCFINGDESGLDPLEMIHVARFDALHDQSKGHYSTQCDPVTGITPTRFTTCEITRMIGECVVLQWVDMAGEDPAQYEHLPVYHVVDASRGWTSYDYFARVYPDLFTPSEDDEDAIESWTEYMATDPVIYVQPLPRGEFNVSASPQDEHYPYTIFEDEGIYFVPR